MTTRNRAGSRCEIRECARGDSIPKPWLIARSCHARPGRQRKSDSPQRRPRYAAAARACGAFAVAGCGATARCAVVDLARGRSAAGGAFSGWRGARAAQWHRNLRHDRVFGPQLAGTAGVLRRTNGRAWRGPLAFAERARPRRRRRRRGDAGGACRGCGNCGVGKQNQGDRSHRQCSDVHGHSIRPPSARGCRTRRRMAVSTGPARSNGRRSFSASASGSCSAGRCRSAC